MIGKIEKAFGVRIIKATITGKRWAFDGVGDIGELPVGVSHRIPIDENRGCIVYGWNMLTEKQRIELGTIIREM